MARRTHKRSGDLVVTEESYYGPSPRTNAKDLIVIKELSLVPNLQRYLWIYMYNTHMMVYVLTRLNIYYKTEND